MRLRIKGYAHQIHRPTVSRVVNRFDDRGKTGVWIVIGTSLNYAGAVLTTMSKENFDNVPGIFGISSLDHLESGDLLLISPDGSVTTLYRVNSRQNFLLITERCNSNCLMCSQPPKNRDDSYLMDIYQELIPLIPKDCVELGLTGGEPTLLGERFFGLLELITRELPYTDLHCLTNGRSFAWQNLAVRLASIENRKLVLGIPLYSDYYQVHDYIVQAKDAFNQTMRGLYNLATENQRLEVRVVLHQQTIPRLTRLARYIYRNLPFVEHVAFMGLENQGYTPHNREKLWIDPMLYMEQLGEAVEYLSIHGVNVSIYNAQLCTLPLKLWKFSRKSISDWKNIYLNECSSCVMKPECGGFFASCESMHSTMIKPFETRP
jgi:His-Xaa-Ser system radical SAM maturase HxsC